MLPWFARIQRGWPPVPAQIISVHHHLRLIAGLRAGERRIDIEIFRPGVAGPELQAVAQPLGDFCFQRVVARVAFGVPEETCAQRRIRTRADRNVCGALGDVALVRSSGRGAVGGDAAGRATARVGTNLRGDRIRIDADKTVISVRSHIRDTEGGVAGQLLLDCEIPFLHRRRFRVSLDSLRGIRAQAWDKATRRRARGRDRYDRE